VTGVQTCALPIFVAEVRLGGRALARGEGLSRKAAEQAAAAAALAAFAG
jgi:dsRNA-specific ribonuclease